MKKYLKHIISALICFLFIVALNFVLPRLLPGDPIAYLTGFAEEEMSAEKYEYYRAALHLDRNIFVQFAYYLRSLFDGTLGYSYKADATVASLIGEKIGYSIQITLPAAVISLGLGLVWGLHSAYKRGSLFDRISTSALIVQNAVPTFAAALLLIIVLCFGAGIFPYSGLDSAAGPHGFFDRIYHLILPVSTVVIASLPSRYLLVRNSAAKFMDDKSVSYAFQRGLGTSKIKYGYVFKNTAQPFVTAAGSTLGACIGGNIIVESAFSINGVGGLLNTAVHTLDYPLMQGILFVTTLSIIACAVLSDIVCILIDPRVKREANL